MAGYCRNMQKPVYRIREWYKSMHSVGYFYYIWYVNEKSQFLKHQLKKEEFLQCGDNAFLLTVTADPHCLAR
jgi:hypothetical protein